MLVCDRKESPAISPINKDAIGIFIIQIIRSEQTIQAPLFAHWVTVPKSSCSFKVVFTFKTEDAVLFPVSLFLFKSSAAQMVPTGCVPRQAMKNSAIRADTKHRVSIDRFFGQQEAGYP